MIGNFKLAPALALLGGLCLPASAAQPWDAPFTADTAALLKSAGQVSAADDQEVAVLLEEHHISIDASGRAHATFRKVCRILQEDAVEDWSSIEETYQPWREQKPAVGPE